MHKPKALRYTYYHCTKRPNLSCGQRSVEWKSLESQVLDFLARLSIRTEFCDFAKQYLPELEALEQAPTQAAHESLQRTLGDCNARITNLVRLKIAPASRLSDQDYETQYAELERERKELQKTLASAGAPGSLREDYLRTFDYAHSAREWFKKGSPERQTEILAEIGSNLTLKDRKLLIEARKRYAALLHALPRNPDTFPPFEPKKFVVAQGPNGHSRPLCLLVRGQGDDVRTFQHWKRLVRSVHHAVRGEILSRPSIVSVRSSAHDLGAANRRLAA